MIENLKKWVLLKKDNSDGKKEKLIEKEINTEKKNNTNDNLTFFAKLSSIAILSYFLFSEKTKKN